MTEGPTTSPLVSVVIPTHNRAAMVERAVGSALAQTYPAIEVVVVDDASTDETRDRLSRFPAIRVVHLERNVGGGAARNIGIQESAGEFVAFLDSDDEWMPEKIAMQVEVMTSSAEIGAVYCRHLGHDAQISRRWEVHDTLHRGFVHPILLGGWSPRTVSLFLVRRQSLNSVGGFDESLMGFQDTDLWLRMSAEWQFEAVDEALTIVHMHLGDRLTTNPDVRAQALDTFLRKWGPAMEGVMGSKGLAAYRRTNMSVALGSRVLKDVADGKRGQAIGNLFRYFRTAGLSNLNQAAGLVAACVGGLKLHSALKTLKSRAGSVDIGS